MRQVLQSRSLLPSHRCTTIEIDNVVVVPSRRRARGSSAQWHRLESGRAHLALITEHAWSTCVHDRDGLLFLSAHQGPRVLGVRMLAYRHGMQEPHGGFPVTSGGLTLLTEVLLLLQKLRENSLEPITVSLQPAQEILIPASAPPELQLDPNATYFLAGGLGALGLGIAD
ncbi:hypothetical protein BST61_g5477 [Cercospora zeina]